MAAPHVVIIGGGFGGLFGARAFKHAPVEVTLIDRHNHHVFQPLLYQVATAGLSPGDIASPIRWILRRQKNVRVLLGEVQAVAWPFERLVKESYARINGDAIAAEDTRIRRRLQGIPEVAPSSTDKSRSE